MTQLMQVAQRILSMSGSAQQKAIQKMRASGMNAWSFPIPQGSKEPRCAKLTPAQQEMYATQKALPQDPRFHLYGAYRLPEGFDLSALQRAMGVLMERHGALRTRFVHQGGALVQEMLPAAQVDPCARVAWHDGAESLQDWIQDGVAEPLPLDKAGLWRVRCRRDAEGVVVLAVFHHLICDAWSMGQLVRELGVLLEGRTLSDAPATQFVDYAAWRELWSGDTENRSAQEFWQKYLAGASRGWRSVQGQAAKARIFGQGHKFSQQWPKAQSDALHESARRWGTTPFLLLLTGFYQLLAGLDPKAPWVVASTMADRPCADVEQSLGYFVKTLVTRTPQGETPEDKLQVLQQDWASLQSQSLSFGRILKTLRSEGQTKAPAILFVLHNTPKGGGQTQGWAQLSPQATAGRAFARFAWSVRIDATPGAPVQVSCEFDKGRLAQADLEAAMQAFERGMQAWLLGSTPQPVDLEALERLGESLAELDKPQSSAAPEGQSANEERAQDAPPSAIEATLCQIWAQVLGKSQVHPSDNFFALGGDSISSLQVVSRALRQGWWVNAQDLASAPTLADLAQRVRKATLAKFHPGAMPWTQKPQLSAAQRWFFGLGLRDPEYFNQSQLLVTRKGLDMKTIMSSLATLVQRHEAMRMCFVQSQAGDWQAQPCALDTEGLVDFLSARVHHIDQSKQSEREAEAEILERSHAAMRGHCFDEGGLFQVQYFDRGFGKEGRLLVVMHHLIVDGVSWRLLLSQWDVLVAGHSLDDVTFSPFALEPSAQGQGAGFTAGPLVADAGMSQTEPGALAQCHRVMDSASMAADTVKARSQALLSAWVQAVAEQQKSQQVVVDLESHGRHDPQAALCVGWLTQRYSVVFDAPNNAAQNLARIGAAQVSDGLWQGVQLCFNDHGHVRVDLEPSKDEELEAQPGQGLWARPMRLGAEQVAPPRAPSDRRAYTWTLNCYHRDEGLHVHWLYDPSQHQAASIEAILDRVAALIERTPTDPELRDRPTPDTHPGEPTMPESEDLSDILEALNQ